MLAYNNQKKWNVGIYARISDSELDKIQSDSISNQRDYLHNYIDHDDTLCFSKEYFDDGISGGSFNRQAFLQMKTDIESGIIDCVIVKDLSRLGRDMNSTNELKQVFFPSNRVRFISVKESIDSFLNPERMDSIDIPFINLMNEQYIKQVSNNTRYSLKIKQKEGKYVGSRAPFGYKKSEIDKHKLVLCEQNAPIVRKIFSLYVSGLPLRTVVNEINTLYPSCKRKWNSYSVRNILENPIYTGDMVQNRTYCPNHKVKKRMINPKEKWIVVPNTHEPVVDKKKFDIVQDLLLRDIKPVRTKNIQASIFAGYLYCGKCGKKLIRKSRTINGKTTYYFICSTYKSHGKTACSTHHIREEVIHNVLLETINLHAYCFVNEKRLVKELERKQKSDNISDFTKSRKKKIEKELKELKKVRQGLYINYTKEIISLEEYTEYKQEFKIQYDKLENKLFLIEKEIKEAQKKPLGIEEASEFYNSRKMFDKLNKSLVIHLVNRVIVYEGKKLEIEFRYKNPLEERLAKC